MNGMAGRLRKILLFVTNDALLAWGWSGGGLVLLGRFPADHAGRAAFSRFISAYCHLPHYVLLDVVEEDFHTETVPHVQGKDHAALLKRKLQQQFRGGRYVNAWIQGREDGGRRDDRVLLSGLLNDELLDGWLDILDHHRVPLASVCSMALLSASIVKRFCPDGEHVLLVTVDRESGIRQSYFRDGELRFSRLTAAAGIEEAELGLKVMAESQRTRQYLASLRLVTRDDRVNTLVLCHADSRPQIEVECRSSETIEFSLLSLEDVAAAFKLKRGSNISVGELLLQIIGWHSWRNHYAPAFRRRNFWLWLGGRWLYRLAALILLAGCGAAGWLWQQQSEIDSLTQGLEARALQAERLKRVNVLPPSDLPPPAVLKQAVERIEAARQDWPSMSVRFRQLAGLYERYPQLTLETLAWGVSPNEELLADSEGAGEPVAPAAGPEASPEEQPPPDGELAPQQKRNEIIQLQGRIEPFTDNYRFAVDSVERFVREWEKLGQGKVKRVKMPLDTGSDKTIDAAQAPSRDTPGLVDYELLLTRPLKVGGR